MNELNKSLTATNTLKTKNDRTKVFTLEKTS